MGLEKTLFINHQIGPKLNWLAISSNLALVVFISTLITVIITYFIEGKFYIDFISFLLSAIAATVTLYMSKTTVSIKFDEDNEILIITQKNGFEKLISKRIAIENSDLSPLYKESGELEFDFMNAYSYTRISSTQKGVSKKNVQAIYTLMRDKFGLKVRILN